MALSDVDLPQFGSIELRLPKGGSSGQGLVLQNFLSYSYDEHFLTPSDAGTFELNQDQLSADEIAALVPRAPVIVSIAGQTQSQGLITRVRTRSSRSSGTVLTVDSKDWLSPSVESHVDPATRFTQSMSLSDLLTAVFAPFGVTSIQIDNADNRNAVTGGVYGPKTSRKGKVLKSYILHQEHPFDQEGAFAFAARVAQRHGLWLWPAVDGHTLIVSKPDFDQAPRYQLRHTVGPDSVRNNVLESDVAFDADEQISCIVAKGYGSGGDDAKSTLWSGLINPVIKTDVSAIQTAYPQVNFQTVPLPTGATVIVDPKARPAFLKDHDSHTQEQLDAFTLREMSLRLRKSLSAHYAIQGHRLGGLPIAVDTVIDVVDDRSRLHEATWILHRRFSKAPRAGTVTHMELVRRGSLVF